MESFLVVDEDKVFEEYRNFCKSLKPVSKPTTPELKKLPKCTPSKLADGSWGCKSQVKLVRGDKILVEQRNGDTWQAEVTGVEKIYSWGGCLVRTTGKPFPTGKPVPTGPENCATCASLYGSGDFCPKCGFYCGY